MTLIVCPECKKQISNQANACVYCGYPIASKKQQKLYHIRRSSAQKSDSKKFHQFLMGNFHMSVDEANACTKYYRSFANNVSLTDAQKLQKMFSDNNLYVVIEEHLDITKQSVPLNLQEYLVSSNAPRCPKCGSTSITTGARGVDGFWGFLGASRTVNRCANCGHSWEPRG